MFYIAARTGIGVAYEDSAAVMLQESDDGRAGT